MRRRSIVTNKFDVIDRPKGNGKAPVPWIAALLDTVETGQAIRIPIDGRSFNSVRNNVYIQMIRKGLKARVIRDGDEHVVAWAEKRA